MSDNKFAQRRQVGIDSKGRAVYRDVNLIEEAIKDIIKNLAFIREGLENTTTQSGNHATNIMLIKTKIELLELELNFANFTQRLFDIDFK